MKASTLRLFANAVPDRTSTEPIARLQIIRCAAPEEPSDAVAYESSDAATPVSLEHEIVSVLEQTDPMVPATEAFRRKEHALGALFAALSIADAAILHRRLCGVGGGDRIAAQFARLVPDRRARLLAFLADARRRAALTAARRR